MTAQQTITHLKSQGLTPAAILRLCAHILIELEQGTTCDMMEIMTMFRRILVEAEKPTRHQPIQTKRRL